MIINFLLNNPTNAHSATNLLSNGLTENLTLATLLKLVLTGPGHKQETTTLDL